MKELSERDSSRALPARHIIFRLAGGNFGRSLPSLQYINECHPFGTFASFLAPSRKEEENIFRIVTDFILDKSKSMSTQRERSLITSYLAMRRLIGVLGIALPIILFFGGLAQDEPLIEGSISGYYYTSMRDFFVGLLSGVALFLLSYKGYEKIDDVVAQISGMCVLGMIIFPTAMFSGSVVKVGMFRIPDNISEYIHLAFGTLFFLSLSYNSIFLFTRRHPGVMGKEKKRRNIIYRTCGVVMLASVVCISIYTIFLKETVLSKMNPVLILESIALLAFGISWLVKGNTLFKDM
jgi:hypothetical protein